MRKYQNLQWSWYRIAFLRDNFVWCCMSPGLRHVQGECAVYMRRLFIIVVGSKAIPICPLLYVADYQAHPSAVTANIEIK
jgi:hypothetical protein